MKHQMFFLPCLAGSCLSPQDAWPSRRSCAGLCIPHFQPACGHVASCVRTCHGRRARDMRGTRNPRRCIPDKETEKGISWRACNVLAPELYKMIIIPLHDFEGFLSLEKSHDFHAVRVLPWVHERDD